MYIFENKDTDKRTTHTTLRSISRSEGINWHTLRYQFKRKGRSKYEKHNFRIDKT